MRIDPLDDLAVELQHEAQHAVRRRVLRAEIDRKLRMLCSPMSAQPFAGALSAFSSPGRM